MAHTKAKATTRNGRSANPKYLGLKISGGGTAQTGDIIVRQRGSKFVAGEGVKKASDDTLYAIKNGVVAFREKRTKKFDGNRKQIKIVSIS